MAKKNKLSAEERRRRREEREREEHAKWLEQFACFGISSEEEVIKLLYEDEECVDLFEESIENGYHCDPPWKDGDRCSEQETLHISTYKDKYIVWVCEEIHDGWGGDPDLQNTCAVFDTLEEARAFQDTLPKGEPCLQKQVMDCKEKLDDPAYWIKAELGGWPGQHNFAIFYHRDLIMENLSSLNDVNYIRQAVQKYVNFKESLDQRGVTLQSIEKPPREWNHNERYYEYEIRYKDEWITLSQEIFKRYQHAERETVDFFPMDMLEKFIAEADAGDPYPGRTKKEKARLGKEQEEYDARLEAAYQGIPHGDGIKAVKLDSKQKKSLGDYLTARGAFDKCDGTPKLTVQWVMEHIEESDRAGVMESIRNSGGYCDCEVIMNYLSD